MIRVAHFYHWTLGEIRRMRAVDFEACTMMMDKMRAETMLSDMSVAQYPHATDKWRKDLHRQVTLAAKKNISSDEPVMSMESFAQMLAGGGGG